MLELYHHGTSVCAAKVRYALAEKQLEWQGHYIDILKGEQFSPDYLAVNPKGVVPTLLHDGRAIPESTIICEYLEDAFPEKTLYPGDPLTRARIRAWTKAVDEELQPACSALTYVVSHRHTIIRNGVGSFEDFMAAGNQEGRSARSLKWRWIQDGLEAPGIRDKLALYVGYLKKMEDALAGREWLAGVFSMADVAMAPYLNRLSALAMEGLWEEGRLPAVAEWFDRIRQRQAFQTAVCDWIPAQLGEEMHANGKRSWPEIRQLLAEA